MPRTSTPVPELFRFAVEDWSFNYGLTLNEKPHKILGLCWESHSIALRGPIRSPTKRKLNIELWIRPRDFKPEDVKAEQKWIAVANLKRVYHEGQIVVAGQVKDKVYPHVALSEPGALHCGASGTSIGVTSNAIDVNAIASLYHLASER